MDRSSDSPIRTVADLLHRLGDVPAERVRMNPLPGTAVVDDLLMSENDCCELVDGTLIQKATGLEQARLAAWVGMVLNIHMQARNLGVVTGRRGPFRLSAAVARAPDVAFTSWDRMPGRRRPQEPIPNFAPDLAVEMVYPSNTKAEMARKRAEYFAAGVRLVWEVDPRARTVRAYTAADRFTDQTAADALDGGDVLPGFALRLADLFAELDRHG